MFPGAPLCDGAICLSPNRSWARCFRGRQKSSREKMCLKLPVLRKCNHCEFSARNCLWTKMDPELEICSCGGPLHWHKALCASPERCHPTGGCHFRNLLAGQEEGIWHHSCMAGKNIKINSPFLSRKANVSACCIPRVGNQLLRDFCWEICALWNSCQGQRRTGELETIALSSSPLLL